MFLLSFPQLTWLDELQQSYATDPDLNKIIQGIQNGNSSFQAYSYNGNVLVYKDRVVRPKFSFKVQGTALYS